MKAKHSQILFYSIIIGFLFLLIYSILIYTNAVFAEVRLTPSPSPSEKVAVPEIVKEKLIAKSYIIYDINNKKIIRSGNSDTILPLASLTKVITVGTFLDTAKNSNTTLRDETKLIIKKALVSSSNEDANALGEIYKYSFDNDLIVASNNLLKKLNLSDIKINNLTGLDNFDGENFEASNVGSALSVAKMFAFLYENHREVFEFTMFNSIETEKGIVKNTNENTQKTFGILASKTGFTFEAGGNLGVIISPEPGSAYVILVMGSSKDGRFEDIEKLSHLLPLITN